MTFLITEETINKLSGILACGRCPSYVGLKCDCEREKDCVECWKDALKQEVSE